MPTGCLQSIQVERENMLIFGYYVHMCKHTYINVKKIYRLVFERLFFLHTFSP